MNLEKGLNAKWKMENDPGLCLWLLLRHAMNRAHAPDERLAVDWDDLPIGKDFLQSFQRARVVGVAEDRGQHHAIGDVEICVTGRQPIKVTNAGACAGYDSGHRQRNNLKGTAL